MQRSVDAANDGRQSRVMWPVARTAWLWPNLKPHAINTFTQTNKALCRTDTSSDDTDYGLLGIGSMRGVARLMRSGLAPSRCHATLST